MTTHARAAEAKKCRVTTCVSALGECKVNNDGSFKTIEIPANMETISICFNSGTKHLCTAINVDRVEVRGLCGRRGKPRLKETDPDYCGDFVKLYMLPHQQDMELFPKSNRFLYNDGSGNVSFGECEELN